VTDTSRPPSARATARLRAATRSQLAWGPRSLDDAVPLKHPASLSTRSCARTTAVLAPGPLTPSSSWREGVSSARELADLCLHHDAYRWLCGGVPIKYRCLSKFRSESGRRFDDLVTKVLALLMQHSLVLLHRIARPPFAAGPRSRS